MPVVDKVTRFRRVLAGLSLAGFALAQLASTLAEPGDGEGAGGAARVAATQPGRVLASALLLLVSAALLIPAIGGIVHLVRGRGAVLVHLGAAFGVLGALGHTAIVTYTLITLSFPGGDPTEMAALEQRIDASSALAVVFPLIMSFGLGMLLLTLALRRAGLVPLWVPVAVIAAVLLNLLAPDGLALAGVAKEVLGTAAMAWIGVMVLRLPDAAWAHPPTPRPQGVRDVVAPAAGGRPGS